MTLNDIRALSIRALSIAGPYARLIAEGSKEIELRSWTTSYRGMVLLHCSASKFYDPEFETWGVLPAECPKSAIIGAAILSDCITYNTRQQWEGDEERHLFFGEFMKYPEIRRDCYNGKPPIGHVFENPIVFEEPILAIPGALNYWIARNEKQQQGFEQALALLNQEVALSHA